MVKLCNKNGRRINKKNYGINSGLIMIIVIYMIFVFLTTWFIMHYSRIKSNPKSHKKNNKKSFGGLKKDT